MGNNPSFTHVKISSATTDIFTAYVILRKNIILMQVKNSAEL